MRIIQQLLLEDGILQTLQDGTQRVIRYLVDENGEEYAELFPNESHQEQP